MHAAADADVGDALLAHVEQQARVRGFAHVSTTAVPEDTPLFSLLQRNGYAPRPRDPPHVAALDGRSPSRWADGIRVRAYTDADARRVHDPARCRVRRLGPELRRRAVTTAGSPFMTTTTTSIPTLWFLVERDGELVACALHWRAHERRGWVKDIVVREDERGRGLGKALIQHGFHEYAARGVQRVGLKVDSTNPTGAPQLYERLGFVIDQRLVSGQKSYDDLDNRVAAALAEAPAARAESDARAARGCNREQRSRRSAPACWAEWTSTTLSGCMSNRFSPNGSASVSELLNDGAIVSRET